MHLLQPTAGPAPSGSAGDGVRLAGNDVYNVWCFPSGPPPIDAFHWEVLAWNGGMESGLDFCPRYSSDRSHLSEDSFRGAAMSVRS